MCKKRPPCLLKSRLLELGALVTTKVQGVTPIIFQVFVECHLSKMLMSNFSEWPSWGCVGHGLAEAASRMVS